MSLGAIVLPCFFSCREFEVKEMGFLLTRCKWNPLIQGHCGMSTSITPGHKDVSNPPTLALSFPTLSTLST